MTTRTQEQLGMTMQKAALGLALIAIGATITAAWLSILVESPLAQPYMRLLEILLSWEVVSVAGLAAVGPSAGKAILKLAGVTE